MLLALIVPAFAETIEVPVIARYREYTGWGEDPVVVDDALTATVDLTNAETGKVYPTRGELFLQDRKATGTGELAFATDPAGSLRTWAVYLLDADGQRLLAEPEIVDVMFGEGGDATIVARESADIVIRNVKIKKRGVSRTEDGTHSLQVTVQGSGTQAAYVGIHELASDAGPLGDHVDMESMTAEVFAAYQELALDALVPLDTWVGEYRGTISVDDITVEGQVVEGGARMYSDVSLFGPAEKGGSTTLASYRMGPYVPMIVRVKKGWRLVLDSDDQQYDTYDGAMNVIIDGDARGLDVSALLTPVDGAPAPTDDVIVALDPSDVAFGGTGTAKAAFPAKPQAETWRDATLSFTGKDGNIMDDLMGMVRVRYKATARTAVEGSDRVRYVGEATRNDDGRAFVRGLTLQLDRNGLASASLEAVGAELEGAVGALLEFDDPSIAPIAVPLAVTLTSFSLDWTFPVDIDEQSYQVEVWYHGASAPLSTEIVGDGWYAFAPAADSTWEVGEDEGGVYAKEKVSKEDAEKIRGTLINAGAEVELK